MKLWRLKALSMQAASRALRNCDKPFLVAESVTFNLFGFGKPGRPPHGCFTSPKTLVVSYDPCTSARMITEALI